jgi:hypothetical protein
METGDKIYNGLKKHNRIKIVMIILAAFLVYYTIMAIMGPAQKIKELKKEFIIRHEDNIDERFLSDSVYLRMLKQKAYLQSGISMAATDSIYLSVNIPDSTFNLEISGVSVHSAKFKKLKISRLLERGNGYIISSMLSAPLSITGNVSSIKKEPLMISMAPKDTSEYQPDIVPDTNHYQPVNYVLEMHNGVRLYVYQEENSKILDRIHLLGFDLRDRIHFAMLFMKSIVRLKVPEYKPFIKIHLPGADAKIIYRAIPTNGQVRVYI